MKNPFAEASLFFTKEEMTTFFKKGCENAVRGRQIMLDEQTAKEKAFQEAQGRANRRAFEAEERIKETGYRHRSDIRVIENAHAEKMENLQYEYEQKIEELKKELAIARGVDPASIEVPQDTKPVAPAAPTAPAANTLAASADSVVNGSGASAAAHDPSVGNEQLIALVTNLEELKGRFETERELRRKAEARVPVVSQEQTAAALSNIAPDFLNEFQQLETLVTRLHSEHGDLAPNALAKSLAEIRARCIQCAGLFRAQSSPDVSVQATHDLHPTPAAETQATVPPGTNHSGYGQRGAPGPLTQAPSNSHLTILKMSGSPGPPLVAHTKSQEGHFNPSPHQGLPTPSEPPFENAPFEQKRSTPVSIHHLLSSDTVMAPRPSSSTAHQTNVIKSPPYESGPPMHYGHPAPSTAPMQVHHSEQPPIKHERQEHIGHVPGAQAHGGHQPPHWG